MTLMDSSCQPTKAELERAFTFPAGVTPDDLTNSIMQPIDIR